MAGFPKGFKVIQDAAKELASFQGSFSEGHAVLTRLSPLSSPTKNLTQPLTNSDSKNPPSLNSKDRLLL